MHSLGCKLRALHYYVVLFICASETEDWRVADLCFFFCWAGNLATSRARVTAASRSLPPQLSSGRNKVCAVFFTFRQSSQKSYSFLSSFQMKMNMNYHIIHFLFWFLYSFICSVKVQIWCKLNAYSFTLDIRFLDNFLCDKESGVTVWATTSYFISHMKNIFASATNLD